MLSLQICYKLCYSAGGGVGLVPKSCPTLETPWTVARQAPLYMGFSRQEYWSGLPCPSLGEIPDPGIKPTSFMSHLLWQVSSLSLAPLGKPKSYVSIVKRKYSI